jgi:acyl dehydratase
MAEDALPAVVGLTLSLNCGFDRVRFPAPAKAGARVRGVFALAEATRRPEREWLTRYETTIEIEGGEKPALAAQWLTLLATRG